MGVLSEEECWALSYQWLPSVHGTVLAAVGGVAGKVQRSLSVPTSCHRWLKNFYLDQTQNLSCLLYHHTEKNILPKLWLRWLWPSLEKAVSAIARRGQWVGGPAWHNASPWKENLWSTCCDTRQYHWLTLHNGKTTLFSTNKTRYPSTASYVYTHRVKKRPGLQFIYFIILLLSSQFNECIYFFEF